MTAPGDGFGDNAHDEEGKPPPTGSGAPEQPPASWEPPAAGYPPPPYPPPAYSPEYQPGYAPQYPPPPTGYEPPPGYGPPPYQPGPPQFGGPPPFGGPAPYPGGYYPPDYGGGYGPVAGMKPGTNKLAIASLVTSFTGVFCCCLGSIVAIVLGAVAINQVKRTQQDGYGLAVAGIVIGIATLVVTTIVFLFAMHSR